MMENSPFSTAFKSLLATGSDQKLQVLVVEESMIDQLITSNFLMERGHQVTIAKDGREAVEMVSEGSFDLILMDLHMPGLDGYQASRIIREKKGDYFKKVPIVALTAFITAEITSKTKLSGMNAVLTKPFQWEELHTVIKNQPTTLSNVSPPGLWLKKLEEYTNGDLLFTKRLLTLFMDNLNELKKSFSLIAQDQDIVKWNEELHRFKTTLTILESSELRKVLDNTKRSIQEGCALQQIPTFHTAMDNLISSIRKEMLSLN